jgi:hypothetical protein
VLKLAQPGGLDILITSEHLSADQLLGVLKLAGCLRTCIGGFEG